jgi:hypothetical protein
MTKDEYIDHELRIRMMEHLYKSMNSKMNALITIAITGLIIPVLMKYLSA